MLDSNHKTHALGYSFKAGEWRFKCDSVCFHD